VKLKISVDGKAYEVDVEVPEEEQHSARSLGGYIPPYAPHSAVTFAAPVHAAPLTAPKPNGESHPNESGVCRSPIAGIVIKVNIQEGQQIQANDLMIVLEAMKMETNVTAPIAGKVKKINVNPGEGVQLGQVLVEFA